MLEGTGAGGLGLEIAVLSGWLVVSFAVALRIFRWK